MELKLLKMGVLRVLVVVLELEEGEGYLYPLTISSRWRASLNFGGRIIWGKWWPDIPNSEISGAN